MASRNKSISGLSDTRALHKEWDDALCPICMDHPHNVVKLLCSSYEKGCRPYICDTSYRHSNCLDRYKNLRTDNRNSPRLTSPTTLETNNRSNFLSDGDIVPGNIEGPGDGWRLQTMRNLRCPLCRGTVLGWKIDEEARTYLNLKPRSCSCENCSFSGNYRELRRHARRDHPTARPSNIDPSRQQAWRSLEHQREYADIVSAVRSAMPGAVVLGDFVIEDGERGTVMEDRERGLRDGNQNGPWWTAYFLFEMIGSVDSDTTRSRARSRSRAWSGNRRSSGTSSRRRYLWGENLLGIQDDDVDDQADEDRMTNVLSDTEEDPSPVPRRRRRFTRSLSEEDQS